MARFPTTNLTQKYVCYAFGYMRARLSILCKNPNINMWAKYKPVKNNFTQNRPTNWWKASNGNCGINVDYYHVYDAASCKAVGDDIRAGISCFSYDPPTGGANAPFRLGDFCGYNPEATHNVVYVSVPESVSWGHGLGGDTSAEVYMAVQWRHDDSMLSLTDLRVNEGVFSLSDWYLGAILTLPGQSDAWRIVTNSTKLADMENVDVLRFTVGGTGEMALFPVIASVSMTTVGTALGGYVIPLPNLGTYTCEVVESQRAYLEWSSSSSAQDYTNSFLIYVKINYSDVRFLQGNITGNIRVAACTATGQPLGAFYSVPQLFSFTLEASSGTASLSGFTVSKASLPGIDDPNCRGLLVVFSPTYSYMAPSVYGVISV